MKVADSGGGNINSGAKPTEVRYSEPNVELTGDSLKKSPYHGVYKKRDTQMKARYVILIAVTVLASLICASRLFQDDEMLLLSRLPLLVGPILLWLWYMSDEDDANTKKGTVAVALAWIPGAGHLYLRKWKRSLPFALMILVSCSFFFLAPLPISDPYLILNSFMLMFYAIFMSKADVTRLCAEMGLSVFNIDTSSVIETDLTEPDYELYTITFFASLLFISMTAISWFFFRGPDTIVWLHAAVALVWIILLSISLSKFEDNTPA